MTKPPCFPVWKWTIRNLTMSHKLLINEKMLPPVCVEYKFGGVFEVTSSKYLIRFDYCCGGLWVFLWKCSTFYPNQQTGVRTRSLNIVLSNNSCVHVPRVQIQKTGFSYGFLTTSHCRRNYLSDLDVQWCHLKKLNASIHTRKTSWYCGCWRHLKQRWTIIFSRGPHEKPEFCWRAEPTIRHNFVSIFSRCKQC